MAYDYEKAFALRDNPFSPIQPLDGLNNFGNQNELESKPLLINLEPALAKLFSPDAGPFGTHLNKFMNFARLQGYRDAPTPRAGIRSNVFSIYGYQGTGKSTMAQAIISWLKTCKPKAGNWHVRDEWSILKTRDVTRQIELIKAEHEAIAKETTKNSYCCVVADNLLSGSFEHVLDLYDELTRDRIVFLFLLSSDRELYPQLKGEGRREITAYKMRPLSQLDAVAFIKHRIKEFRIPAAKQPPWLEEVSLFPFDENDIRSAFASGIVYKDHDTIALRDFSKMVNSMLTRKIAALDDNFDITKATEAEIAPYMIWLAKEYNELVAA